MGELPVISRMSGHKHHGPLATGILVLWFLQSFHPVFHDVLSLCEGGALEMYHFELGDPQSHILCIFNATENDLLSSFSFSFLLLLGYRIIQM